MEQLSLEKLILIKIMSNDNEVIINIPIFSISPDKNQPRKIFSSDSLQELANSIAKNGVIVPIIVKPIGNDKYSIIAGERRWRASLLAKMDTIPAIVRDENKLTTRLQSILENVQRDDLNPLEEAYAYSEMINNYNLSHADLAEKIGKSRASISNSIRLLKLPSKIKKLIIEGKLSNGHAKAILSLKNSEKMQEVSEKVVQNKLSVRDTENLVKKLNKIADNSETENYLNSKKQKLLAKEDFKNSQQVKNQLEKIENQLSREFSRKVKLNIITNAGEGNIKIEFSDWDDLNVLIDSLLN